MPDNVIGDTIVGFSGVKEKVARAIDGFHAVTFDLDCNDAVWGKSWGALDLWAIALGVGVEDWNLSPGTDFAGNGNGWGCLIADPVQQPKL